MMMPATRLRLRVRERAIAFPSLDASRCRESGRAPGTVSALLGYYLVSGLRRQTLDRGGVVIKSRLQRLPVVDVRRQGRTELAIEGEPHRAVDLRDVVRPCRHGRVDIARVVGVLRDPVCPQLVRRAVGRER